VDTEISVQLALSPVVLLLINFIVARRLDFDRIAVGGSFLLLICTALFWASLDMTLPFSEQIYQLFMDYNYSGAVDREFFDGGATFTLQLGTAPWLFVGFCVVGMRLFSPRRQRWDGLKFALIAVGILVSGLRGLIGITLLYAMYLSIKAMAPRYRWMGVLAIMLLAWIAWVAVLGDSQVFSSKEESNSVKLGHFQSYLRQLTWLNGLFGEGLGSYYYSTGTASLRSYTELTPIDMARYLGIPLTLVLYAALIFPLRGAWRYTRRQGGYTIAILLFTALSISNPVMFNSYGLLVVVWYWCSLSPSQRASAAARLGAPASPT